MLALAKVERPHPGMRPFSFLPKELRLRPRLLRVRGGLRWWRRPGRIRIRIVAESRGLSERTAVVAPRLCAIQRLRSKSLQLQLWLIGRGDQAATRFVHGIVDKLPLVVFPLLVELANRVLLDHAGHAHDGAADHERLAARSGVSLRRARSDLRRSLRGIRAGSRIRSRLTRGCLSVRVGPEPAI